MLVVAMSHDSLGDRQKGYESVSKTRLIKKMPVLIRFDGCHFHSFARNFEKPYDKMFHEAMWSAATHLCETIQGAKLAYVQSDEISILITDWETYKTESWFDNQVQKMCSVGAAECSVAFVRALSKTNPDILMGKKALPTFDARVWNLPESEVANCFLWRQQDATRNSVQMAGQSYFSHKELQNLSGPQIQEKLFQEKQINFNDYPVAQKRGVCIVKEKYQELVATPVVKSGEFLEISEMIYVERSRWTVDENIPIFSTPEGREYIERFLKKPE